MVTAHERAPHWTPARGLARPQPSSPCGLYLPPFSFRPRHRRDPGTFLAQGYHSHDLLSRLISMRTRCEAAGPPGAPVGPAPAPSPSGGRETVRVPEEYPPLI